MRSSLSSLNRVSAKGSSAAWDPSSASTSIKWWHRGDDLTQESGDVSQVNDKSGNAIHVLNSDSAKRPLYVASAVNGQPAWQGDGVDEYLVSTATLTLTQPYEVWIFCRVDTYDASNYVALMQGDATQKLLLYPYDYPPKKVEMGVTTTVSNSSGPDAAAWTLWRFLSKSGAGNSSVTVDNGTPATGTISADPTATTTLSLLARTDGTNPGIITMAEDICFDGELSAGDQTNLITYFNDRYGQSF